MKNDLLFLLSALFALSSVYGQGGGGPATTPVPTRINFQGRVAVDNVNFEGNGQFKFALISTQAGTSTVVWTNDGSNLGTLTAPATGEPAHYVTLPVAGGLYSLMLGDTTVMNDGAIAMPELLPAVAASLGVQPQSHLQLRVWFNDGPHGFQLLAPDQKLTSVVYAFRAAEAANVSDGAITAAKMANGAVGSAQLAAGSVGSTHLQGGAVSAANIADGAVGSTQIANASITVPKLNLGVLQGTALDGTLSGLSGATTTFITTYSPPFLRTPNVVLSSGWSISSSSQTGFSATRPSMVPSVRASNGDTPNILSVNGFPAISFRDASVNRINFVRATSADGSSWGTPIVVDNSVGSYVTNSMAVINGNPAIAYYDGGQSTNTLYFVRATNANGSAWGTRVLVPMAGYGGFLSVTTVSGRPAIAASNGQFLSYIRANDANGTSWGTPVQLTNNSVTGDHCSLSMISGNPAVSYRGTNGQLFYVRANDTAGLTWGTPIAVGPSASVFYTTLKEIEGRPAIAYYELTGGPTEKLKYVRASDTTGASWPTPTQLDTGSGVGPFPSLTTLGGKPVIAYKGTGGMRVLLSTDSTGGSWAASLLVDATSGATAIAEINSNLSIAYCNPAGQSTLKYTTLPTLNWSASDGTISPLVAAQVASGAVGAEQIASNAITSAQIADGTITSADIGTNAVGSSMLADGSVTTSKIADSNVTSSKLATGAVGTAQLALGSVTATRIASNTITSQELASGAVGTAQLTTGSVTADKIAFSTITAQQIATGAVGTLQLATGSVTADKIASSTITAEQIAPGAITTTKLGFQAVTAHEIASGTISEQEIAPGAITTAKLADGSVLGAKIPDGSIAPSKLLPSGIFSFAALDFGSTTRQHLNLFNNGEFGIGVQTGTLYQRSNTGFAWFVGGSHSNAQNNPGASGSVPMTLNNTGVLTVSGSIETPALTASGHIETPVLTITGGADVAEPFPTKASDALEPGEVLIIDEDNPGHLKRSERGYDSRVAGIVSGAGGVKPGLTLRQHDVMEGNTQVALTGRVYVKADSSNGPIKPGDLITTSETPGHAARASDAERTPGSVIGKAMSRLEAGDGLVLVLVSLQ